MNKSPSSGILIGIAGGTGSGKTKVARNILKNLGSSQVTIVQQDAYYRDLPHLTFEERSAQNFDHPDAIDIELLIDHVRALLRGESVEVPVYDFTTHRRLQETRSAGPHSVIILEGILILYYPELRNMMDIKIYVDTDADLRLVRRLRRDIHKRGRSLDSVLDQYEHTVQPSHLEFVEPTKRYADIIIPEGGLNRVAVDLIETKIHWILNSPPAIGKET